MCRKYIDSRWIIGIRDITFSNFIIVTVKCFPQQLIGAVYWPLFIEYPWWSTEACRENLSGPSLIYRSRGFRLLFLIHLLLSIIQYVGAVCFQFAHFLCDDVGAVCFQFAHFLCDDVGAVCFQFAHFLYDDVGAVCFQFVHFLCDDWENIYTLSYYHHQIGSMNYYPLFRVRSWKNGMCFMCFYMLMMISTSDSIFLIHQVTIWHISSATSIKAPKATSY